MTAPKASPTSSTSAAAKTPQAAANPSEWMVVDRRRGKSGGTAGKAKAQNKALASTLKKTPPSKQGETRPGGNGKGRKASQTRAQTAKPRKIRPPPK